MAAVEAPRYTRGEEIANSVSHGVGALLAIAAIAILTTFAALRGGAREVVSCVIFSSSLFLAYLSSTLYHALTAPRAKRVFRVLDHSAIFLLIAGSYTPFTLASMRGAWGWTLFGIVWGLALLGIVHRATTYRRWPWLSLPLYVGMGWVAVLAIRPLMESLPGAALALIVAGGVSYTVGIAFYAWRRLPYSHAIWHGFVLVGSALHFVAILVFVAL